MSNSTSFNVAGKGTETQKRDFRERQVVQAEKYREFRVDLIDDDLEKNEVRRMMRTRDHEMEIKHDLDREAIEREIDVRLINASQPTLEYHPENSGGRTFSRLERNDAIRHDTYQSMSQTFDEENADLLDEKNRVIDEAIDQTLEQQEQAQSMEMSEGFTP